MALHRCGLSNYFFVSRRDIHAIGREETYRHFLNRFKNDPGAMRDLRAPLGESFLGFRVDARMSDDETLKVTARLLASGELLLERDWPEHGGSATQSGQNESLADARSAAQRAVKTWIEIELLDDDGQPVAAEAFQIELPDGRVVHGRLDSEGKARFGNIDPGTCQVSFPAIDGSEWKAA